MTDGRGQRGTPSVDAIAAAAFGVVLYVTTATLCFFSGFWVLTALQSGGASENAPPAGVGASWILLLPLISYYAGLLGARLGMRCFAAGVVADVVLGTSAFLALLAAAYVFSAFNPGEVVFAICFRLISPTLLYLCSRVPSYWRPRLRPRPLLIRTAGAALAAAVFTGIVLVLIWTIR